MRLNLFSLLFMFFYWVFIPITDASAQKGYIADLVHKADIKVVLTKIEAQTGIKIQTVRQISASWNIWYFDLVEGAYSDNQVTRIGMMAEIEQFQQNHAVNLRKTNKLMLLPNDMLWGQQWSLMNTGSSTYPPDIDIDAEEAWEVTTGGHTISGDTIVVAIIDSGFGEHPELVNNLWINTHEIPNDLVDNDLNGFVDDYKGWNVFSQNDDIQGVSVNHGTAVAGIIGATGNNTNGIAGINWDVKMMCVTGGYDEAEIIAAYDYIYMARKRYNESNGSKGAFVTVVNCSFGIDYGQPGQSPIWCSIFDSLGHSGILSVAATANNSVDIDIVGDLPTTCPSDYLISVTSLNRSDSLAPDAAWGFTHVDLGAYGENIFSTKGVGNYGWFAGTSFAAPHVSAAVALLYAAPCPDLIAQTKSEPSVAALMVKDLVLNTSTPNPVILDKVGTGGVLNLNSLIQKYEQTCMNCPAPFALIAEDIGLNQASIHWTSPVSYQYLELRWRIQNTNNWVYEDAVESGHILADLLPCNIYEVSVRAFCADSISSIWSYPVLFVSEGCCQVPSDIQVTSQTANSISIEWPQQVAATKYTVRIRQVNSGGNWLYFETLAPYFSFTELSVCQDYEIQVQSHCGMPIPLYSNTFVAQTAGCGACLDAQYCYAASTNTSEEWIQGVLIGGWLHDSGSGGPGYENFNTLAEPILKLLPAQSIPIVLVPGFSGQPHKEYFKIFIDFNMDGDFDDVDELACDPGFAHDGDLNSTLYTPNFDLQGFTRMRVVMKFYDNNTSTPLPCGGFEYGQVEDYCVYLETSAVSAFQGLPENAWRISPIPARQYLCLEGQGIMETEMHLSILDVLGNVVDRPTPNHGSNHQQVIDVNGLASGIYFLQIRQGYQAMNIKFVKI